ncbi:MAG: CapA family protein [Candidatus Pacebacteria bacterium]|nr:CapA family protein [Candidatus Paceibacterota bacterium]
MNKLVKIKINIIGFIVMSLFLVSSAGFPSILNNSNNEEYTQNDVSDEVRMIAVGDIMLSREVERKMINNGDFKYPFLKTAEKTKTGDIIFGNLETSIINGRAIRNNEMVFRTDLRAVEGLVFAGFNVLSLANNHIMNFGRDGLESTIKTLDENNISHIGAGMSEEEIYKPVIKDIKGTKFAFLGFTYNFDQRRSSDGDIYGMANMSITKMEENVKKTKSKNDIVIVSMHAGTEYKTSSSSFQENFAQKAIDAGADLIIGHHPHVVQNVQKYKQGYIIYSLGNFVFDQMWSNETRLGAIAEITFQNKKIKSIEFIPVKIYDYSQPTILEGTEAEMILERLKF